MDDSTAESPLPTANDLLLHDAKPATSNSKRIRSAIAVLVVLLFIAVAWVVEIDKVLESVRQYEPVQFQSLAKETLAPTPLPKECAHLNHRDPGFVTDENKNLCLSQAEVIDLLREIVFTASKLFDANNVTYFLESGTLLGSYRERGVIRHDKDADLGIDANGLEYLRHNPVTVPDDYNFTVWNSSLYPNSARDAELRARLIHRKTALYADVFAFLDWKDPETGADEVGPLPSVCFGGCKACPTVNGLKHFTVPRDWVYRWPSVCSKA